MTAIVQDFADVADALDKGVVGDGNSGPDLLKKFRLRYRAARILCQIAQHLHGLWPQREVPTVALERSAVHIQRVVFERQKTQWKGHVFVHPGASFRKFSSVFNSLRDAGRAFSARLLPWTVIKAAGLAEQ
jgi:hypothetical protein